MKQFFSNVIRKTTLYYSIIIIVFSSLVLFANSSESTITLDPSRILLFLPFCIALAIANTLLGYKDEVEAITRWSVHFVLTTLGAFLFIILPADLASSSGNFIGLVIVIALYMVGVLLYNIIGRRIRRTIEQDKQLRSRSKNHK